MVITFEIENFAVRKALVDQGSLVDLRDKENITLIEDDGNYFYQVMPYGLQNTCATYQWLMS